MNYITLISGMFDVGLDIFNDDTLSLLIVIEDKRNFLDGTSVDPTGQWTGAF